MPNGIPVATVALNASKNAGILAASILSVADNSIAKKLAKYKEELSDEVLKKVGRLQQEDWQNDFDKDN
jgi:5-(carboxyamino)imidazole ribonucleotide mutase